MIDLMCLMHVLYHAWNPHIQQYDGCLRLTKILKIQMKIGYQCWRQKCKPHDVFYMAIQRTLSDMKTLAEFKLQKMIKGETFLKEKKFKNFVDSEDSDSHDSFSSNSDSSNPFESDQSEQ